MRIVLDTNIFLTSVSSRSKTHWIMRAFAMRRYTLCITTEILAEYAETIENHMGAETSQAVLDALLSQPNILEIEPSFRWAIFHRDPDDNKFVDCAVASNADFIVSHDRGFRVLKARHFPKIEVISADDFKAKLGV